ncbi:MAG: DUF4834 domain-containing protein [Flavobacterium sp.]
MQEASFPGLIRDIIFFIGFYYLVKFLGRLFLPMIMRKVVSKAQENFNQQAQGHFNTRNNTDFQSSKSENKSNKREDGDYVDYEEVD